MTIAAPRDGMSLRVPIAVSAALHLVVIALFLLARGAPSVSLPPTYKVSLVAAPPGPRQIGVVQPTPAVAAPTPPQAPVSRAVPDPSRMKAPPTRVPPKPVKPAKVATPSATPAAAPAKAAPAPAAGGGPQGGRGADVANVQVAGTDFPYPEYLQNVVRQIAIRFKPPGGRDLQAVVAFLIRRDGSVTGIRLTTRSGVYSFDTEAMGAVDAAAGSRAFGPLPQGFADDVLPVIFSFDPRLIR
ncbi:MAG: TonB C-terminal domain-containing protein [Gemmatimonadaceae bacterium]